MGAEPERATALVAITRRGALWVRRLAAARPGATLVVAERFAPLVSDLDNELVAYRGRLKDQIAGLFSRFDQIVFFISLGAVVRLIAPHLTSKHQDPGIVVIDDAAQFAIPVLSGHIGGANALAAELAARLGARAVITTASDVGQTIPIDLLGRELGWRLEAAGEQTTRVAAQVVNGEPIAFVQEAGRRDWWHRSVPLPANIHLFARLEDVDLKQYSAILWVTHREIPPSLRALLQGRLIVYRPPAEAP